LGHEPCDKLLTIDEVAGYLRLNRYTVYRMAERGELPGAKIARRWRFEEREIRQWLQQRKRHHAKR
jgi:excisionase family DNA binding protein